MRPGLELRREPRFERSYRRNVGEVYHFALGVLSDPSDAEEVTRATFQNAYRESMRAGDPPDLNSLLTIAHEVCRIRGGHRRPTGEELAPRAPAGPCEEAELAICRRFDGRLPSSERRMLRRHLASCADCRAFAELQRAQRGAITALSQVPLPASLDPRTRRPERPRLKLALRVGALAGTAALVLTLAASGELPGPRSFIGGDRGPDARAGVVEKPDRKFHPREASPR